MPTLRAKAVMETDLTYEIEVTDDQLREINDEYRGDWREWARDQAGSYDEDGGPFGCSGDFRIIDVSIDSEPAEEYEL